MKFGCIETDPLVLMSREKSYCIHKNKVDGALTRVDTSSPFEKLPKILKSKTPDCDLQENNLRIYTKLTKIYNRPARIPRSKMLMRSSPSINRQIRALRIANENEILIKKLTTSKPTYSFKDLQKQFKETKVFSSKISKFNQMLSSKKLIKTLNK